MLLAKLRDYSERLEDLGPLGYAEAWVRYEVHLTGSGELVNPEPIDLADAKTKRGQRRQAPQVTRASGVKPLLLNDNAEYTFGLPRQEEDPDKQASRAERTAASHAAYMGLLGECAAATESPAVQAVLTFLRSAPLDQCACPRTTTSAAQSPFAGWPPGHRPAFRPALLGGLGAGRRINRAGGR